MVCWCKIYKIILFFIGFIGYSQEEDNLLKAFERSSDKQNKKEVALFGKSLEKPIPTAKKSEKEIATFKEVHEGVEIAYERSDPRNLKTKTIRYTAISEMINPLRPQDWHGINSKFGTRVHPVLKTVKHHSGIDIPAPTRVPVYAVLDGVVIFSGYDNASGNYVKIDHGNGLMTSYAHLSKIEAWKHQEIDRGQIIGRVGATGRVTGPHLHYTVIVNGKKVNPEKYLLWK
ncbi:M23 family metallopeptidase [Elizabethkingia ursingii]